MEVELLHAAGCDRGTVDLAVKYLSPEARKDIAPSWYL